MNIIPLYVENTAAYCKGLNKHPSIGGIVYYEPFISKAVTMAEPSVKEPLYQRPKKDLPDSFQSATPHLWIIYTLLSLSFLLHSFILSRTVLHITRHESAGTTISNY